jgi:hypothetical protein|eukprot:COSAG06_NODE_5903_length_3220_cov_5.167254_1_plen_234_part_00
MRAISVRGFKADESYSHETRSADRLNGLYNLISDQDGFPVLSENGFPVFENDCGMRMAYDSENCQWVIQSASMPLDQKTSHNPGASAYCYAPEAMLPLDSAEAERSQSAKGSMWTYDQDSVLQYTAEKGPSKSKAAPSDDTATEDAVDLSARLLTTLSVAAATLSGSSDSAEASATAADDRPTEELRGYARTLPMKILLTAHVVESEPEQRGGGSAAGLGGESLMLRLGVSMC